MVAIITNPWYHPLQSCRRMKLSLGKNTGSASYDEESNIFEPVTLRIILPNATDSIQMKVTTGDTVSIIKKRCGALAFDRQAL